MNIYMYIYYIVNEMKSKQIKMAIWVVEKKVRKMAMITVPVMKKSLQALLVFQLLLQEPSIEIVDRWQAYLFLST